MRQLTFVAPEQLEWWDVPAPGLESATAALVRPVAVARCDLDFYIAIGLITPEPPFSFGHEMVAEVVDIGDSVTSIRPGDRVIVSFQIHCGDCDPCRAGHTNACVSVPFGANFGLGRYGGIDFGGALADLVRVPYADAMALRLPAEVDPVAAANIADNASDGFRTVAPHLADQPGAEVLVVGGLAQSVGLYAVQAALALGASRVVYTDFDALRLAMAEGLGADTREVVYEDAEHDERFPITVDTSGLAGGRDFALASTAACGVCTSVSNGAEPTGTLDLYNMYRKGIRYDIGRVQSRPTMARVLDHVCAGDLHPEAVVSSVVDFDDAAAAMTDPTPKVVFTTGR